MNGNALRRRTGWRLCMLNLLVGCMDNGIHTLGSHADDKDVTKSPEQPMPATPQHTLGRTDVGVDPMYCRTATASLLEQQLCCSDRQHCTLVGASMCASLSTCQLLVHLYSSCSLLIKACGIVGNAFHRVPIPC